MSNLSKLKVAFFGTPDFALNALSELNKKYTVAAVITQPDKPRNRGQVSFSPVKELALKLNIPVYQFEKIRAEGIEQLRALGADIGVTAAYGQILSKELIDLFPLGIYNIHASLLPKYRGSCPIQWAVINGEKETGVTIMRTDVGLDTGDIVSVESVPVGEETTAGELFERLSALGANMIVKAVEDVALKKAVFTPQNPSLATVCKMLAKSDGAIDWTQPATNIHNLIRGLNPAPIAYAALDGLRCKILSSRVNTDIVSNADAGTVLVSDIKSGLIVKSGKNALEIITMQMPSGKAMAAKDYLKGHSIAVGSKFLNGEKNA